MDVAFYTVFMREMSKLNTILDERWSAAFVDEFKRICVFWNRVLRIFLNKRINSPYVYWWAYLKSSTMMDVVSEYMFGNNYELSWSGRSQWAKLKEGVIAMRYVAFHVPHGWNEKFASGRGFTLGPLQRVGGAVFDSIVSRREDPRVCGAHILLYYSCKQGRDDDLVILLNRERSGKRWGLPGGKLLPGETVWTGLIRELMEEKFPFEFIARDNSDPSEMGVLRSGTGTHLCTAVTMRMAPWKVPKTYRLAKLSEIGRFERGRFTVNTGFEPYLGRVLTDWVINTGCWRSLMLSEIDFYDTLYGMSIDAYSGKGQCLGL